MSERPIIFSAPMVRAILDGRKTQTRRLVKGLALQWLDDSGFTPEFTARPENGMCPYGVPGDRLWVRETWFAEGLADDMAPSIIPPGGPVWYAADNSLRGLRGILNSGKSRPSIHMPRWASRITLEIVSVRVERLQEITEADADAEGIIACDGLLDEAEICRHANAMGGCPTDSRPWFATLWDSINAKRAPWESNPWVWVIEFRRAGE